MENPKIIVPIIMLIGAFIAWLLLLGARGFKGEASQMPVLDAPYHFGNWVLLLAFMFAGGLLFVIFFAPDLYSALRAGLLG